MFRQYRKIESGEFFIIVADCSQGGADENFAHFISKTKLDIPLVYQKRGVAAEMTSALHPVIEKIFDLTGIKPLVCFERNNGGGSEMQRLDVMNRLSKYNLYKMKQEGLDRSDSERETDKLGWETNVSTRPVVVGLWGSGFNSEGLRIYDEETIKQHKTFIINKVGKPEAAKGMRDDAVISAAIGWKLIQSVNEIQDFQVENQGLYGQNYENINSKLKDKWRI